MTETILITGASTGFGRDTAETLARAGHEVFASMRDPEGKNRAHADALRAQNIEVVELDVTDSESVDRATRSRGVSLRRSVPKTGLCSTSPYLMPTLNIFDNKARMRFAWVLP